MSRAVLHTPSAPGTPNVPPSNTVGVYPRHPLLGGAGYHHPGAGLHRRSVGGTNTVHH